MSRPDFIFVIHKKLSFVHTGNHFDFVKIRNYTLPFFFQTQTRINSFFQPENFLQPKNIKSKRLQRALNIMQGKEDAVTGTVEKSGDSINQYVNIPVRPALQSTSMIRQSTVGKGRGRGKGKGKGKGKSSVGQRSKVVITNEVNLSESSSESSGDELIANLDYESIIGAPSENSQTSSNQENNDIPQVETKVSQPQPTSKSKSTTRKTSSATEANSHTIVSTQNSNGHSNSANVTGVESQTSTSRVKGRRTKPNVRVGKSGHATEDFSVDLPREHINMKGFLEDEAKTFDKVKKVKAKTMTTQSSELKEQKSGKGKKLSKNAHTKTEKVSEKSIIDTSESESKEPKVTCDSLLYRRTRSCKTGLVNRVLVVSDSDSD